MAEFAGAGRGDMTAQGLGQRLHAVADAEHGLAAFQHDGGQTRGIRFVDAGGAAGEDEGVGVGELLVGRVPMQQFAVDAEVAHTAGDKLGGLGAEVDDGDGVVVGRHGMCSQ